MKHHIHFIASDIPGIKLPRVLQKKYKDFGVVNYNAIGKAAIHFNSFHQPKV